VWVQTIFSSRAENAAAVAAVDEKAAALVTELQSERAARLEAEAKAR
jgi:hypothetical protein